jgi:S1 RNA binding domain protein
LAITTETNEKQDIVGKILKGTITNITNFGAFVNLGDNQEGLIHISEVADEFITDINDFIKSGEEVTVKVLAKNNKNKYELSLKKAKGESEVPSVSEVPRLKKQPGTKFEDKITQFIKRSEERQIDIRRNLKKRQGISKRKRV